MILAVAGAFIAGDWLFLRRSQSNAPPVHAFGRVNVLEEVWADRGHMPLAGLPSWHFVKNDRFTLKVHWVWLSSPQRIQLGLWIAKQLLHKISLSTVFWKQKAGAA